MPQCRSLLNTIPKCCFLILSWTVFARCADLPAFSTNNTSLLQVSFSSPPTAQTSVDVFAVFSSSGNVPESLPSLQDPAGSWNSPLELRFISADLSVFGRYTASNAQQAPEGSVTASFSNVVFPKGGQYVLAFDGHLPLSNTSTAAANSSQQQQAVSARTVLGVGARPSNSAAARYNGSRSGLKEVIVRGRPLQQPHSGSSLELLLLNGSGSGAQPTAAAASSNHSSTLQGAYRVLFAMPDRCVPGQPATYTWTLLHAGSGELVTGLQLPGSTALVVASDDLSNLQLAPATLQPSAASSRANSSTRGRVGSSSSGGGGSVYIEGSRLAPGAAVAAGSEPVHASASDAQEKQQLTGRRLRVLAGAHAALRVLQQAGSSTASAVNSSRAGQVGPSLSAQVELPQYGTYLFLAEVVRGDDELVVMPLYVVCSDGSTRLEPAAANFSASGAAAVRVPWHMLVWAAVVLSVQQLLL